VTSELYGDHPIYAAGGDVAVEQDVIYLRLRAKWGKERVRGYGYDCVDVRAVTVDEVASELLDLGYTMTFRTTRDAVMRNLVAVAVVATTSTGVSVDLETPDSP